MCTVKHFLNILFAAHFLQNLTGQFFCIHNHSAFRQLLELVENNYKKSYECVRRIAKYIYLEFGYQVSDEEKMYLTIHIERVREHNASIQCFDLFQING